MAHEKSNGKHRDDDRKPPPTVDILERPLPRDEDAERAVLGGLLLAPESCDDVALIIGAEDFFLARHQILYRHLVQMNDQGTRIDPTILLDRLRSAGDYEKVGGGGTIAELVDSVPHAAHVTYYARIVREKATTRGLILTCGEILSMAYAAGKDSDDLLGTAEERIFTIRERKGVGELVDLNEALVGLMEQLDAAMKSNTAIRGLQSGFEDLDEMIGGFQDSELTILAGRPSMGKTALACNIAEHVAIEGNVATLLVSLEMSKLEVANRLLCSRAEVDSHKLRDNTVTDVERGELVRVSGAMSSAPLFIDDSPSRSMLEIAAIARRLKRRQNLGLVVVDYLQLIEPDNTRDQRQEQVARIARRLKTMARELKVPVLCLAQLNRQAETTKDNRPRVSHLRESGAIEQDADVVMFVHREEVYHAPEEIDERGLANKATLIVAKNRNGPIGDVDLTWQPETTRFRNAPLAHQVDPF